MYAPTRGDRVFGYGPDAEWLLTKSFKTCTVVFEREPRLTTRMILDGIATKAGTFGYAPMFEKMGRCRLFKWQEPERIVAQRVSVFKGYDIRALFLADETNEGAGAVTFHLVVDVCYALRDDLANALNFRELVERFGSAALKEVRQIQRDLIPTGINTEVSRERLAKDIVPFVKELGSFALPCNIQAKVLSDPVRIVVGAQDESLW